MPASPRPIVVIGSINMDLVCRLPEMPRPGETLLGSQFATIPGGKGANQAVAAARLSRRNPVQMIGRVGADDFGRQLIRGLRDNGVGTRRVDITDGAASGVAMILVDERGENSIVVAPGANHRLSPRDIDAAEDLIASAAVVVLQLEIPLATVRRAIAVCKRLGVFTILDPAPAPTEGLPRELYHVDLLTPNQTEAEMLLQARPRRPEKIAAELLAKGPRSVVLKLGADGAIGLAHGGVAHAAKGLKVKVVDTTAAGDAFTAALAVGHAEGMDMPASLRLANAAGGLCCTAFGAQPALPTRRAVERILGAQK